MSGIYSVYISRRRGEIMLYVLKSLCAAESLYIIVARTAGNDSEFDIPHADNSVSRPADSAVSTHYYYSHIVAGFALASGKVRQIRA